MEHYPPDDILQKYLERSLAKIADCYIGRKLPTLLHQLGLEDIVVHFEPDRLFSIAGSIDDDRRENLDIQGKAAWPYIVELLGSEDEARQFLDRLLGYYDRPDSHSPCTLYFVKGRVPQG